MINFLKKLGLTILYLLLAAIVIGVGIGMVLISSVMLPMIGFLAVLIGGIVIVALIIGEVVTTTSQDKLP